MALRTRAPRTPSRLASALADPIVQALMAADRIDKNALLKVLRRIAARLDRRAIADRRRRP